MKVTVFTSNQPRHTSLIESLCSIADEVWCVRECNTVFPGEIADFLQRSETMQEYFSRVIEAERFVFGLPRFAPANARELPLKMGDLNRLQLKTLSPALESDAYVVFGASFIKGELVEFLTQRKCFNIHMGCSPYYRGSSTNFWALYDNRPDYVGATIHMLTRGLDSGPMLFHAFPPTAADDPFVVGMKAVRAAHEAFTKRLADGSLWQYESVQQDKSLELRYTRNQDFTDGVAKEYLERLMDPAKIRQALEERDLDRFIDPYVPTA